MQYLLPIIVDLLGYASDNDVALQRLATMRLGSLAPAMVSMEILDEQCLLPTHCQLMRVIDQVINHLVSMVRRTVYISSIAWKTSVVVVIRSLDTSESRTREWRTLENSSRKQLTLCDVQLLNQPGHQ